MNCLLSILLTAILCASASAQTIKTLGFNSTNGQVVANTGTNTLQFTNTVNFGPDFSLASTTAEFQWGGVTFFEPETKIWFSAFSFNDSTNAATTRANLNFSTNLNTLWTATNASNARSAVELSLPALTNTSNVTMLRALSGTTNTSEPFSGTFVFVDDAANTWSATVSNGIILSVIEQ